MKVQYKLLEGENEPMKMHPDDAGFDLTVATVTEAVTGGKRQYIVGTGVAVNIPPGYVGYVHPRSSIWKHNGRLANGTAVIDAGYTGEIKLIFDVDDDQYYPADRYRVGERCAQLVILKLPDIELEEVEGDFAPTARGSDGFGSTGEGSAR